MNQVVVINYDLVNPGRNYEALIKRIKAYKNWARLGGSAYLILTAHTPEQVRDYLGKVIDAGDKLWVGVAPAPSAWQGLPEEVANWILANQR
jgi:hypothetical protein